MRSKNFKVGGNVEFDVMKQLDLNEGVVQHLENEMLLRNALPEMSLDARLKKMGKLNAELRK